MTEWFVQIDGQRHGPVDATTLRAWVREGRLKPSDLVWREGVEDWVAAVKVKGLFEDVDSPEPQIVEPVGSVLPVPLEQRAPLRADSLDLATLRTSGEATLRIVCLVVTALVFLAPIGVFASIAGLFVALQLLIMTGFMMLAGFFALAVMLAEIRGNGIKVGPQQFPKIYDSARRATEALGLGEIPEIYVIQSGGMLNAFAARWAFRRYVVLYSDLVDACGDDSAELDMIMAHEIGHMALGHLWWMWLVLPARLIPFLGHAYSRACEYSADRCGFAGCGDPEAAKRGLMILAAGGKLARVASMEAFLDQRDQVRGFWQTVVEWIATHPWLTRRVEALHVFEARTRGVQPAYQPAQGGTEQ